MLLAILISSTLWAQPKPFQIDKLPDEAWVEDLNPFLEKTEIPKSEFIDQTAPNLRALIQGDFVYRVTLQNMHKFPIKIFIGSPINANPLAIFALKEGQKFVKQGQFGIQNPEQPKNFVLNYHPIGFGPNESKELFMIRKAPSEIKLASEVAIQDKNFFTYVVGASCSFALIVLIIYNFNIGLNLRDKTYFYYCAATATPTFISFLLGAGLLTLLSGSQTLTVYFAIMALSPLAISKFILSLLDLESKSTLWYRFLRWFPVLPSLLFLFPAFQFWDLSQTRQEFEPDAKARFAFALQGVLLTSYSATMIKFAINGSRMAKYAVLAFTPLMLVGIFLIVAKIMIVNTADVSPLFGSTAVFEGVVFSLALAEKHKLIKQRLIDNEKKNVSRLKKVLETGTDASLDISKEFTTLVKSLREELSYLRHNSISFIPNPDYREFLEPFYEEPTGQFPDPNQNLSTIDSPKESHHWKVRRGDNTYGKITVIGPNLEHFDEGELLFIENLVNAFGANVGTYLFIQKEKERLFLKTELEAAGFVQQNLLVKPYKIQGVDIAHYYQSAEMTGGDWFGTYYDKAKNLLFLCCGDVTGHGLSAALITGVATGAITAQINSALSKSANGIDYDPEQVIKDILASTNTTIHLTGYDLNRLMTLVTVAIDLKSGNVWQGSAGHNPVYHFKGGSLKSRLVPGSPLGIRPDIKEWKVSKFTLEPGDTLIAFTDGLLENEGPSGEVLSKKFFRNELPASLNAKSEAILKDIVTAGQTLWGDHPPEDDCTILVVKWDGPVKGKEETSEQEDSEPPLPLSS